MAEETWGMESLGIQESEELSFVEPTMDDIVKVFVKDR